MAGEETVPVLWEGYPVVSGETMRRIDFDAIARFGMPGFTLMDNSGKASAVEIISLMKEQQLRVGKTKIVICCGRGANGGDGLMTACALKAGGIESKVFICPPKSEAGYPQLVREGLAAVEKAGIVVIESGPNSGLAAALAACDIAVDALLGTGSRGEPLGAVHHMVQEMVNAKKPMVAIDIPTGLNVDTGDHTEPCISAQMTLTLGLPKRGLIYPRARRYVGRLKVLDIGYPAELIKTGEAPR